ncbi:helicase SRCAP [Syngnathoides biaculeatus]|uniref:helicase SRCAP n=1 Tax=Syngnathoides biaculeatus TaxID=300417 RepID=UPI002ADE9485|nr:helicase SRCAP [Syngnathoides biaculeatus]
MVLFKRNSNECAEANTGSPVCGVRARAADVFLTCGGDPNFSILEVESTEDLCLTPQTGAACGRSSSKEGGCGEAAVRQRASPAVDVLGGKPQAAHNVSGESHRRVPQPAAAATRVLPPLPESVHSTFLVMETTPPVPIGGNANVRVSRSDGVSQVDGVNLSPAEDFRPRAPLTSHPQNASEFQGLQRGLHTVTKETHLSNSETHHIEFPQEGAGAAVGLQHNSEIERDLEFDGKHTCGTVAPQAQLSFTASALSNAMEHGATGQSSQEGNPQDSTPAVSAPSNCSGQVNLSRVLKEVQRDARINEMADASNKAAPLSAETLETPNAGGPGSGSPQTPVLFNNTGHAQTGCVIEEPSDSSPKSSTHCSVLDSGLLVSLQAQSEPSQPLTETPMITELVHSAESQEIVVVSEAAHLGGGWPNVHLKQSYLLQRADGSVCEAAIVTEHTPAEAKLYEESMQANMDLETQNVEVYQFCSLVEEVAEETVCVSTSVQIPHSPGYEVNLFNALLDSSEDLESNLEPSIPTINDSDAVIISHQDDDAGQQQVCSNSSVHSLSVAAVGQHLLLDTSSSQVCLVEVDSFPMDQTPTQVLTPCPQVSEDRREAEGHAALSSLVDAVKSQQVKASVAMQEARVSSPAGTKGRPSEDLSQHATVSAGAQPEAFIANPAGGINPKLLIIQPGAVSLLKQATSLLKQSVESKPDDNRGTPASAKCLAVCSSPAAQSGRTNEAKANARKISTASRYSQSEALNVIRPSSPTPADFDEESAVTPSSSSVKDLATQHDSPFEDEDEDDDDEHTGDAEAMDAASGQISSEEDGSDEDAERPDGELTTPSTSHKWLEDGVSPSTSSSSFLETSPGGDWAGSRRDKSSPLRGPHGKFVSPTVFGGYTSSPSALDQSTPQRQRGERRSDMAELAKHEADIEHRSLALKREGFWSTKRLNRLPEPPRPKVHWDYLCEEMQWLSADFAQERRWKRGVARKVVRMVMRHHEEVRQKEEKAKRDELAKIRRVASSIAKEVRAFWSSVEKVVQYKQQSRLEEKRKKALDLQLDFIVGQTEKYSDLLSKSLAPASRPEPVPSPSKMSAPSATDEDDQDFEPPCDEEDDEETIEVEEQQDGNDAESHRREIELLKEESALPLDQLLSTLQQTQDSASDEDSSRESSSSAEQEEDGEFSANEEDAEDEEDTIAAQEKVEGDVDHAEELDDLAKEGDMSMEELIEKYKGAYASNAEEPSASVSKVSSDWEASGDEEDDSDEEESDIESTTSSSESPAESEEEENSENGESDEEDDGGDEGMEVLLKEGDHSPSSSGSRPKKEISHIAATAESLQPKGYTLATTKVKTPIPFLLHGTLREYQHIGLEWLVTMFEKKLNGILADEMGLGKTIQTIALLAHLACEKSNWGPHLIIVPTSVMLNWEMELKRWCPGFKILTYFGSQKERKLKRQGWTKPNAFHVCITSYKLVLQDHQAFRRKSWRYLILDEAQNIKNFKSQRWQSLLNFNSHRRLLLTGTPLQNSLMELWSLMHFLMPHVFQSHREFKEWFSNPLTGMIEGSQEYNEGLVKRLHKVLRPFLLRRIKADVEKQMPKKYEHVVRCRLSKRQRFLYDDFMAQASTKETLASGHFMSVINILMQLRKVCNHPNLFDPRPIQSPFITKPIVFRTASLVLDAMEMLPLKRCDLSMFDLIGLEGRVTRYQADVFIPKHKVSRQLIQEIMESPEPLPRPRPIRMKVNRMHHPPPKSDNQPTCSVPPESQMPKPSGPEATAAPAPPSVPTPTPAPLPTPAPRPAPAVQQVMCSVMTTPPPRLHLPPAAQTAVRSTAPKQILTVRAPPASCTTSIPAHPTPNPGSIMPQRVLLSPDMQARLPSGEVVSIAQLASMAGRPVSSCQGSKPVTFQLQGNKLTLSGAPLHQAPPPRPVQGNVMHLLTTGGQHHLISRPIQVQKPAAAPPAQRLPPISSSEVPSSSGVSSSGVVKIVVRHAAGKERGPVPTLAVAPSPRVVSSHSHPNATPVRNVATQQVAQRTPGPATAHYTLAPPRTPSSAPNQAQPPVPILKIVQPPPPCTEQPAPAEATTSCAPSKSAAHDATGTTTATATTSTAATASTSQTPAAIKPKPSAAPKPYPPPRKRPRPLPRSPFYIPSLAEAVKKQRDSKLDFIFRVNDHRCAANPVFGKEVLDFLTFLPGPRPSPAALRPAETEWGRSGHGSCLVSQWQHKHDTWCDSHYVGDAIHSIEERLMLLSDIVERFTFAIPPVESARITMHCCHPPPSLSHKEAVFSAALSSHITPLTRSLHRIQCNMRTQFPDLRLIQYDCGKLQTLHLLLRNLKTGGHRVLIFTQMTRMLDVLEQFLNYHGHIYLRLDGSTRVEQRQALMERFNADRRIFCFILSTRSGGVGVNLTGADTVVFYDSDWNPTMDAQAQDRCHRIGQTRDVHIYRLISERTVEENILKKANQKRMLGDMAIEGGNFTTAFFKEQTIRELFDVNDGEKREAAVEVSMPHAVDEEVANKQSTTILEQALCRAEDEEDIVAASQAKAEQVAELAEFNENIPLEDAGEQEEVEELSKAEQEIAALVEQLTPIERYAMNFLEASLEDVCKEELKQAEEQVEAARKGLDQAKEGGLRLNASSDEDEVLSTQVSVEASQPAPARRGRKPKDKDKVKVVTSTRTSGRLRGASPETEPTMHKEVTERARTGLRGRGAAKDSSTPSRTDTPITNQQDPHTCSKTSSPARDQQAVIIKSQCTPVPSSQSTLSPGGKQHGVVDSESKNTKRGKEDIGMSESSLESICLMDHESKDDEAKDQSAMSPPSTSCRSPRKRQSADGEVLKGLVDDSPSAKVLRKLPGRLVTVVEEKEPRKRRWRGSGAGASSEEASVEENLSEDTNKDFLKDSLVPDSSPKETVTKFSQDQDSTQSPPVHLQPVRAYPPYSPPHLSPDMPVLRNLPVRRRLETESRMAAQFGEQINVGRGRTQHKKIDSPSGKETFPASTEANVNTLETPMKRKRGRPPKCPSKLPDLNNTVSPPQTQTVSPCEDGSLSPKRKRGRPRKDSVNTPDFVFDGHKSKKVTPASEICSESNLEFNEELPKSENTDIDFVSTKTEEMDSNTAESALPTTNANEMPSSVLTSTAQADAPPETQVSSLDPVSIPSSDKDTTRLETSNQVSTVLIPESTTGLSPPASLVLSSSVPELSGPSDTPSEPSTEQDSAKPSTGAILASCPASPPPMTVEASPTTDPDTAIPSAMEITEAATVLPAEPPAVDTPPPDTTETTHDTATSSSPAEARSKETDPDPTDPEPSNTSEPMSALTVTACVLEAPPAVEEPKPEPLGSTFSLTPSPTFSPHVVVTTITDATLSDRVTTSTFTDFSNERTSTASPDNRDSEQVTPLSTTSSITTTQVPISTDHAEVPTTSMTTTLTTQMSADTSSQAETSCAAVASSKVSISIKTPSSTESSPPLSGRNLDQTSKMEVDSVQAEENMLLDIKRRKVAVSLEADTVENENRLAEVGKAASALEREVKEPSEEIKTLLQKRSLSRQSSQDSARSSSPSSGCSTSTLTRHAHHKRTYENRHPTKRQRVDVTSDAVPGDKSEADGSQGNLAETSSQRRAGSGSSSSSCDSDNDDRGKERRLTRQLRDRDQNQDKDQELSSKHRGRKPTLSSDSNANTSTGGDSGSDSSSVRITRRSLGSCQDKKALASRMALQPPEPEVLGKRCSALNAAAKLLAMKGRVDTPGHTPRKDPATKPGGNAASPSPDQKSQKSKTVPASLRVNSVTKIKSEGKSVTANQGSRPVPRSTRQFPGSLVPPLEAEYKRAKAEEKEPGSQKVAKTKECDGEVVRGRSTCSSKAQVECRRLDGERPDGGQSDAKADNSSTAAATGQPHGSRSRSSSDSSRRAHSVSSQNTDRKRNSSRTASSGSDRDRSTERGGKNQQNPRKSGPKSQKLTQEAAGASGEEGTPDRILRSVAAAAAVQARSPAASTRSSANQQRHNKT